MSLPWSYTSRVIKDLDRWHRAGWIDDRGRAGILSDMASRSAGNNLPGILAILGATLIGFAAMSFVAANWQGLSKLARLLVLMTGMWGAYGGAAYLFSRQLAMFGHAAVLTGSAIFGAAIMLVAQMYHIEGNPPDAVLMWAAGALLAGAVFQSGPVLGLSMLAVGVWGYWETQLTHAVYWPFLPVWAAVAGTFLWLRWRPGLQFSAIALVGWIISLCVLLPNGPHYWLLTAIGAGIALLAAIGSARFPHALAGRIGAIAPAITVHGAGLAFAGLMIAQFWHINAIGTLLLEAMVMLALVVGAIYWAMHTGNKQLLWGSYAAFSVEVLALYFRTFGTLLNTSFVFASGGLLVIGLAVVAFRLMKQKPQTDGAPS